MPRSNWREGSLSELPFSAHGSLSGLAEPTHKSIMFQQCHNSETSDHWLKLGPSLHQQAPSHQTTRGLWPEHCCHVRVTFKLQGHISCILTLIRQRKVHWHSPASLGGVSSAISFMDQRFLRPESGCPGAPLKGLSLQHANQKVSPDDF